MGIFDKHIQDLPEEFRNFKTPYAVFLADRLDLAHVFWGLVLIRPTPASFNATGGLAVRQFVELVLPNRSPRKIVQIIGSIITSPESSWSDLGISQINDDTVGAPLSMENKMDILQILEESSAQFLTMAATEIMVALGHISFGYGHGFLPTDVLQQNYSYGYGFQTEFPDYFSLITAFEQKATQAAVPSFFMV